MEIEFTEGASVPRPPDQVRFFLVSARPYPDRRRIKLSYELSPFLTRPNVEIRLVDPAGEDLGSITIIGAVEPRFTLTAHLRGEAPRGGQVRIVSVLSYENLPQVDRHDILVTLPEGDPDLPGGGSPLLGTETA